MSCDPLVDFDSVPGVADTVAYLVSAQVRRGTPLSPTVTPGLAQVECPARCCWYVLHTRSGFCVFTGRTREQAEQAARSLAGGWSSSSDPDYPSGDRHVGAVVRRLHEKVA